MFRDPTVEEEHEKRLKNMKMGGDPATIFFQKLEREAKLAGRRDDMGRCRTMVAAVQQGVPLVVYVDHLQHRDRDSPGLR